MKYKNSNPLEKLHPGEPYFMVRAQDKLSVQVIDIYKELCYSNGLSTDGLDELINAFKDWQAVNQTKFPD